MNLTPSFLSEEDQKLLATARSTFGSTTQILVAVEELCELANVCAKYPRYDSPSEAKAVLYDRAIDEVSDVLVVLDHVVHIFNLAPEDIQARIQGKLSRLERWMSASTSMDITTKDREVPERGIFTKKSTVTHGCEGCEHVNDWEALAKGLCQRCITGTQNHYKRKEPAHETGGV